MAYGDYGDDYGVTSPSPYEYGGGGVTSPIPYGGAGGGGAGNPWLGLGLAGASAAPALAAWAGGRFNQPRFPTMPQASFGIPPELGGSLSGLDAQIAMLQSPQAMQAQVQRYMPMVTEMARQEAAARGLEGPMAANLATTAQARLMGELEQQRMGHLQNLMQMRSGVAGQLQQARTQWAALQQQRMQAMQAARMQQLAAQRAQDQGLGQLLGTGLGLGIGAFGGPAAPWLMPLLAGLGGQAGGAIGGLFAPQADYSGMVPQGA